MRIVSIYRVFFLTSGPRDWVIISQERASITMFRKKEKQQKPPPPPPRAGTVDADELVKGNSSIEYLAEPYIIVVSGRTSMRNLSYAINLIATKKDYRITDFSVTEFFGYLIMEKKKEEKNSDTEQEIQKQNRDNL
jgi:hypothetical protein